MFLIEALNLIVSDVAEEVAKFKVLRHIFDFIRAQESGPRCSSVFTSKYQTTCIQHCFDHSYRFSG